MKKYSIIAFALSLITSTCLWAQKMQPKKPAAKAGTTAASMAGGKALYLKYCLTCHQADGGGVQNMNPPLVKTSYVLGDKATLVSILQNGFKEEVEINGDTYSNNMPSFSYLTDKEIADVLTFVRNSFGNKASAVTLKEVSTLRPKVKK
jgi:mono/diheme cytochrome c family protein